MRKKQPGSVVLEPGDRKTIFPKQQPYNGPVTAVAISADGLRGCRRAGKAS